MNAMTVIDNVFESGKVTRISMQDVIREYSPNVNRHWFDKETLGFFNTKFDSAYKGPQGIYFVATNQDHHGDKEHVAVFHLKSQPGAQMYKVVKATDELNSPKALKSARETAKKLAAGYPRSVGPDDVDLYGDLLNVGDDTLPNKIRLVWNSLDKEDFVLYSSKYSHFSSATARNPIFRQMRVFGHFLRVLNDCGIYPEALPKDVLQDMHNLVTTIYGESDSTHFGGSFQHFIEAVAYHFQHRV